MVELSETVALMESENYQDRFRGEYFQSKIRYEKLRKMLAKYFAGTLDFKPECPIDLLKQQKEVMDQYLYLMEERAEIEGIDLTV